MHRPPRLGTLAAAIFAGLASAAAATAQDAQYVASPISVGQRYFMATHHPPQMPPGGRE